MQLNLILPEIIFRFTKIKRDCKYYDNYMKWDNTFRYFKLLLL